MKKNFYINTPVMKQYFEIKEKYNDTIVLFRMGDFYETFLNDAVLTSKILGIVLTKRSNGKAADVELAGFPYHSLDNYLPKLVKAGHRVAICEQVENPKLSKGIVKRKVIEVVTPGTLSIDKTLNNKLNRYIGSIITIKKQSGFSFLDSSTGEFYVGECSNEELNGFLLKFLPQEIILSDKETYSKSNWYLEFQPFISRVVSSMFDYGNAYRILLNKFKVKNLKGFGCDNLYLGISAAGALINHIKTNLSLSINHISKLSPVYKKGYMGLDSFTIRNLEIFNSLTLSQGLHGTLIQCLDMTKTSGGGRLLRKVLMNPLTDILKIKKRLNIVEAFVEDYQLLNKIRDSLKNTSDVQRIIGKLNQNKGTPKDIIALANTLEKIPIWKKNLKNKKNRYLDMMGNEFSNIEYITQKIINTLNQDTSNQISQGNVIKSGLDANLDELRILLANGKDWIESYKNTLRKKLDIPKLKVGFNKIFGYYIEVSKVHQEKVSNDLIRKQTLVNSERYITKELKEYEEKIISAEEKILEIETNLFNDLCVYILNNNDSIQKNASAINHLDFYCSFSSLAIKNNYIKPIMYKNSILEIKEGRHPVVEQLLPPTEKFIPNNTIMNNKKNQIHLLTGPNMAGKSTYLRQVGLIVYMAQIGCFVPARKAKIGIVDKLFTRVGASDNLAGGESTFMIEMNEAANILNNATNNSLILLDEIGRGTSTYDGLSIAWAITEYIHNKEDLNARTIFATHYHELTQLENILGRLENHHVEIKEYDDSIIFMRSILKGPGDKSYGIHVAKMAGLPQMVTNRAEEILSHHIEQNVTNKKPLQIKRKKEFSLQEKKESELLKKLKNININNITPLEALKYLDEIKKDYNL